MSNNSAVSNGFLDFLHVNAPAISSFVLFCIIFLILGYSIFKRLFCGNYGRNSPRNQVQRLLPDESNTDDPSLQFQSRGLDFSVIQSLPIYQFKKNEVEQKPINVDCAICLGEFEEGEWLKHLPNCTHVFHVSCVDIWFQSHSSCPLCRSHVLTTNLDCSISMYTLLQTLRREDFSQERAAHFQFISSEILQNLATRQQTSSSRLPVDQP